MRRNGLICCVAAVAILAASDGRGGPICHPSKANRVEVFYSPVDANTAVKLWVACESGAGWIEAEWYVSFFTGDQPTLWEFAEIQNTASELLKGGA